MKQHPVTDLIERSSLSISQTSRTASPSIDSLHRIFTVQMNPSPTIPASMTGDMGNSNPFWHLAKVEDVPEEQETVFWGSAEL